MLTVYTHQSNNMSWPTLYALDSFLFSTILLSSSYVHISAETVETCFFELGCLFKMCIKAQFKLVI
jgi:hypothetical protein